MLDRTVVLTLSEYLYLLRLKDGAAPVRAAGDTQAAVDSAILIREGLLRSVGGEDVLTRTGEEFLSRAVVAATTVSAKVQ